MPQQHAPQPVYIQCSVMHQILRRGPVHRNLENTTPEGTEFHTTRTIIVEQVSINSVVQLLRCRSDPYRAVICPGVHVHAGGCRESDCGVMRFER